jgi:hypothetical protein
MKPTKGVPTLEGLSRRTAALWLVILTILTGIAAYFTMLTRFMAWDDEGALMLPVKQYLEGMKLYQDVFSVYGPVYFFYSAALRFLTGTPVTHDVTRTSSVLPWLAASLLCAWIVWRLTKSIVAAAIGLSCVSLIAAFFKKEPGHPQELVLTLLFLFAAFPLFADVRRRRTLLMFALGSLAAALMLIKVNVGALLVAALALALIAHRPTGGVWKLAGIAVAAGCAVLPAGLMWNHLDSSWAQTYWVIATASIAAASYYLLNSTRAIRLSLRDILWAVAGLILTAAAVFCVLAAQHVSFDVVLESLVFLPSRIYTQDRNRYLPHRIPAACALLGLAGAAVAVYAVRTRRPLHLFKAVFSIAAVALFLLGADLLPVVAPFAWLVLCHANDEDRDAQEFPRTVLCSLAVIQTLYAYPIYGSQGDLIQCLLLTVVAICAGDSLYWLLAKSQGPAWLAPNARVLATAALLALTALNAYVALHRYRNYSSLPALDLPGARRLHVEPDQKREFTDVARNIKRTCDVFEALPGLPSFNFWTGEFPVTGFNNNVWMLHITPERQQQIVRALETHPKACFVYNPELDAFWNPGKVDQSRLPLIQYMHRNFRPELAVGEYQIWTRDEPRP